MSGELDQSQGRPVKITLGEMREMGLRGVLVYCADYRCSHHIALSADHWFDDLRLSDMSRGLLAAAAANAVRRSGRVSKAASHRNLRSQSETRPQPLASWSRAVITLPTHGRNRPEATRKCCIPEKVPGLAQPRRAFPQQSNAR